MVELRYLWVKLALVLMATAAQSDPVLTPQAHAVVASGAKQRVELLIFNHRNPLFWSAEVRQGLAIAVRQVSFCNNQPNCHSDLPVPLRDNKALAERNVLAGERMVRGGWKREARSGALIKAGSRLEFSVIFKDLPQRRQNCELLRQQWLIEGAVVTCEPLGEAEFHQRLQHVDFTGAALLGVELDAQRSLEPLLHSRAIPSLSNEYRGQNYGAWHSPSTDATLEELAKTADGQRRTQLMAKLATVVTQEVAFIPLCRYN